MPPSIAELRKIKAALVEADRLRTYSKFNFFKPYPRQKEFFNASATHREILLMAGNRVGKSEAGAFMTSCHLTGNYPDWWQGRRWDRPTKGWASGETATLVRDVQQKKLCGEPGVEAAFGTGYIPKDLFVDKPSMSRSATDAYDTIQVRHKSGGTSVLRFKSYEQGRAKFQGENLDFAWNDEECDIEIYAEILTRCAATTENPGGGVCFTTFTPLKGRTAVVLRFTDEPSPDRCMITMSIDDAEHISDEERRKIVAGYRAHEREARSKGIPILGSGKIFQTPEDVLLEDAIAVVPEHWKKIWGVDFGIGHPFAAVLILWDVDADVMHVHFAWRASDMLVMQHAAAMKPIGAAVPVAWPQDGLARDKQAGKPLSMMYKAEGLKMLHDYATFEDGSNSTEAGILLLDTYMKGGRFKVARHLVDWLEEYRFYHRKDGQIVKIKDDLMSATRVAAMAKRHAQPVLLGGVSGRRRRQDVADGVDFDLFG